MEFNAGFHKSEKIEASTTLRWAHQTAALQVQVPVDGRYRLIIQAVTVFSPLENVIEVSCQGQKVGNVSTHTFDFTHPAAQRLELSLRAGRNDITLKSNQPEVRLGVSDERTASFGLLLPIKVEKAS